MKLVAAISALILISSPTLAQVSATCTEATVSSRNGLSFEGGTLTCPLGHRIHFVNGVLFQQRGNLQAIASGFHFISFPCTGSPQPWTITNTQYQLFPILPGDAFCGGFVCAGVGCFPITPAKVNVKSVP